MPYQKGKNSFTIKQLIVIILLRYDASRTLHSFNPTLRDLQDDLELDFGRKASRGHISFSLRQLDREGIIERDFNYWHAGRYGNQAQASRYTIKDLSKGLDLPISDRDEAIRQKAREKKQENARRLPDRFYMNGYSPGRAYIEGSAPFLHALATTDIGPKFPKRDPRNMDKVNKVHDILIQEKTRRQNH